MMKKTKTPTSPRMHWLPVIRAKGSFASLPSAMRNEWENTTDRAAASRTASKLLARWPIPMEEGPMEEGPMEEGPMEEGPMEEGGAFSIDEGGRCLNRPCGGFSWASRVFVQCRA